MADVTTSDILKLRYDIRTDLIDLKHDIKADALATKTILLKEIEELLFKKTEPSSTIGRRIVCAAMQNKHGRIITGVRHFDGLMHTQINFSKDDWEDHGDIVQGFVDQKGIFLTRTEAWPIAKEAGQIIRRVGGDDRNGGTLYSENLY